MIFWTAYDIGLILYYWTALLFAGLAVSFALQSRLLNIGCEAQLQIAAIVAAAVGLTSIPAPWSYLACITAAVLSAGLVAGAAGWIRGYRGGSEVIATLMLNFIVLAFCQWVTVEFLQDPESQNPQTPLIGSNFFGAQHDPMQPFFDGSPASIFLFVALTLAVGLSLWEKFSPIALRLRAVGTNPKASQLSGLPVARTQLGTMVISGALASGVGINEVLGASGQFRLGFSNDYGFTGIAVALVAQGRFARCIPVALLFALILKVVQDLEVDTTWITKDISLLVQGLTILILLLILRRKPSALA